MAHNEKYGTAHRGARRTARRMLRREAPSTVALLADEEDFAAMRRYTSFAFPDHPSYLRQVEGLLKELATERVHTTVALFDPVEYAEYCSHHRLDPDSAESRARYVAEIAAAGGTVVYAGQPVDHLVPQLVDAVARQSTWESATELLTRAGDCPDRGTDLGEAAGRRAALLLRELLAAAGPGRHHLVCSVPAPRALIAALRAEVPPAVDGKAAEPLLVEADALLFSAVLAAGIVTAGPAGVVLRTEAEGLPETVRGWVLEGDWLRPLTEAEVFAAYCTDIRTGEPVPPEHGVAYRAGFPLARPQDP
ncbi:hypothetical protein [Streptomyces palmae]|uniref:Uncharacterized protein n=1 Tax=Streptomyces palmae TaxID=1701085 RepID=A0A4Z0GLF4_9ACTN|nr:hypothetical protein [Streptomyces palmae]TGA97577.1 hypothetical protein E4099_23455 [Streptomyces palmae]